MGFGEFLSSYYDVENQLSAYLIKKAHKYFIAEELIKRNINAVEEFEKRRTYIRQYFIDALGGLDMERTPLNPICTGIVERNKYYIKKVTIQSQPGFYVTTNLYIPRDLQGKAPGILFACGHNKDAKAGPAYQKVCIDLAKNGFIVLAVDPLGQGERMQYYDKSIGRSLVNWGTVEHSYSGLQCNLTGSNIARYFVWDLIRSLDYLCSLPEVDNHNIGMTGASGGGTQTSYMMLVDDRIKAAVPCNYITSREDYIMTGQAHDGEQNIFGAIAEGLNNDDFVLCFAPKPVMIGSTESDFFCVEGAVKSYERARHIYNLYGCGHNINHYIAKGTHAYNDELRQAAVNWLIVHLKGQNANFFTDSNMTIEDAKTLWCTDRGQVLGQFDDALSVFDLNIGYFKKHKYKSTGNMRVIRENIEEVLNMPKSRGKIYPRFISNNIEGNIQSTEIFLFSEEGIAVAGIYMNMVGSNSDRCTILLLDEGTKSIVGESELIYQSLNKGDVFIFDPRGVGAVKSRCINPYHYYEIYGTEFKLNYDAMMMKTSLTGLRVYDITRACDFLNQFYPEKKIELAGKGIGALYALLASVINDVDNVYLENMISSFEDIVGSKYYHFDTRLEMHGVLKKFDIPGILAAYKNKNITIFNSPNADS